LGINLLARRHPFDVRERCQIFGTVQMKTDEQIKKIITASIRRSSMDINTWKHTRFWDEGEIELNAELFQKCNFEENELPIIYSYIDPSNWMMFTTKAVQFSIENQFNKIKVNDIKNYNFGNFKGTSNQTIERITIETKNNEIHKCPFETGKASMGSIYALRTLIQIS